MNPKAEGSAPNPTDTSGDSSLPFDVPDVTGWLLAEAKPALEQGNFAVRLVETAPPPRKPPKKPAPEYSGAGKPVRLPVFGEWRVLCWSKVEAGAEPAIELLVARELLGETRNQQ